MQRAPQGAFVAAASIVRYALPSVSVSPACALPSSSWDRITGQSRAFRSRSSPRHELRPRRDSSRWQRPPSASRGEDKRFINRKPRTFRDDMHSPRISSKRNVNRSRRDTHQGMTDEYSEYSQRNFADSSAHDWNENHPHRAGWTEYRETRPHPSSRGRLSVGRRDDGDNQRSRGPEWGRKTELSEIQRALSSGDDLLYGLQSVHLALTAGRRDLHTLYLQTEGAKNGSSRKQANTRLRERILAQAETLNVRVCERDKGELNMLAGNRPHQGTVLRCGGLEYVPLQTLEEGEQGNLVVALDEVRDPQNVGALLRSAHFLGVKGVAVCRKNSSPITPVVSRASAGAAEIMEVYGVESMPKFLRNAADKGWRVFGAAGVKDATPLGDVVTGPPTVLVLGSEGDGLRSMVQACCANLVTIEKGDGCISELDSLNVSVAGALAMFHLLRR